MAHYFLAIPISAELRAYYHTWQQELRAYFPYKKWTAKEDYHITLSFLGEANDEQLEILKKKLRDLELPSPFSISMEGIDTFGQTERPRVLYVDVLPNRDLMRLQQSVVNGTVAAGFTSEKRAYRPHLTIGKKWVAEKGLSDGKLEELKNLFVGKKELAVTEFILYKIHPQKTPSYEAIAAFPL